MQNSTKDLVQHILLLCTRSFLYSSAQAIASRLVILQSTDRGDKHKHVHLPRNTVASGQTSYFKKAFKHQRNCVPNRTATSVHIHLSTDTITYQTPMLKMVAS